MLTCKSEQVDLDFSIDKINELYQIVVKYRYCEGSEPFSQHVYTHNISFTTLKQSIIIYCDNNQTVTVSRISPEDCDRIGNYIDQTVIATTLPIYHGIIYEKCHDVVAFQSTHHNTKEQVIEDLKKQFIAGYEFQWFLKHNPDFKLTDEDELTDLLDCCHGMEISYKLIIN